MKKNNATGNHLTEKVPIKHFLLIMRTTLILLFTCVFCSMAEVSYTQNARVTINKRNVTLKEVLNEMERQTDCVFIYSNEVNTNEKVSLKAKEEEVSEVLDKLFKDKNVKYSLEGNHFILSTIERVNTPEKETIAAVQQQKKTITGTVVDAAGQPIIGANIVEVGTTNGTVTDVDGNFSLSVEPDATIRISYIGYLEQNINTSGRTSFNIVLQEDTQALEEVVVIGYGTQRKEEVTSSIASVRKEDFNQGAIASSALQLVQGKVPGLAIQRPYSDPNRGVSMQLRGVSTVSGNNNPLIIIDGIPGGNLNAIPPEDIESIDVLKDGSAAAIYGTRATNGVIIVTTKKGRKGISEVSYSGYMFSESAKFPDLLTANEWRELAQEYRNSSDPTKQSKGASMIDYGADTDWFKEVSRTPISQVHHLSVAGGNQSTTYSASLNYRDIEGVLKRSFNESIKSHLSINHTALDERLNVVFNLSGNTQKSSPSDYGVYHHALKRNPTLPVYNEDGTPFETYGWDDLNPIGLIEQRDRDDQATEIIGNTKVSFEILSGLTASVMGGIQKRQTLNGYYDYKNSAPSTMGGYNGSAQRNTDQGLERIIETTVNYSNLFKEIHRFELVGGYSYEDFVYEGFTAWNNYFITDQFTYNNLGAGDYLLQGKAGMGSYKNESKLISFFGRAIYSYQDKYLLNASIRQEGSSKFGKNNKWGLFPAISLGWRLTEEPFMQNISWLDNLKLRAGYGVTGNQGTAPYTSLVRLRSAGRMLYNNEWIQGVEPASNPNPDLKWETKHEYNIGLDMTVFNNRLTTSIDLYNRLTKDLIYTYNVPTPPNIFNETTTNVGEIRNRGIEFTVNALPLQRENFQWILDFNISYNQNKLISLSNEKFPFTYRDILMINTLGLSNVYTFRLEEGQPIGNMYGYIFAGFTDEGKWQYYNKDGEIILGSEAREEDKGVMGNGLPKMYSALTNTFKYKNFDFSFMLRGAFLYDVYALLNTTHLNAFNLPVNVLSRSKDIELFDVPAYNSYYAERGDYVKLDNVTLGYNFNVKDKFVKNARIYVSGNELYTFTNYSGVDPEVEINGLGPGFDWREGYPRTKTFAIGVNLTF